MEQANANEDIILQGQYEVPAYPMKVDPRWTTQKGRHDLFVKRMMNEQQARSRLAGSQLDPPNQLRLCDSHAQWVRNGCDPDWEFSIRPKNGRSPLSILRHRSLMPMCYNCVVKRIDELGLPADKPIGYIDTCLCAATVFMTECTYCQIFMLADMKAKYLKNHTIDIEGCKALTCACGSNFFAVGVKNGVLVQRPDILRFCAACQGVVSVPVHAYDNKTHLVSPFMQPSFFDGESAPKSLQGNYNECGVHPEGHPTFHNVPTWFARLRMEYQLRQSQELSKLEQAGQHEKKSEITSATDSTAYKDPMKPAKQDHSESIPASSPAGALASRPTSAQAKRKRPISSPRKKQQGGQPSSQESRPSPMASGPPPNTGSGQYVSNMAAPQTHPAPVMLPPQPGPRRSASTSQTVEQYGVDSPQAMQQGQSMSPPQALQNATSPPAKQQVQYSGPSPVQNPMPKPFTDLLNSMSPPANVTKAPNHMPPTKNPRTVARMTPTNQPATTANMMMPSSSLLPPAGIMSTQYQQSPLFKHMPDPGAAPPNVEAFRQQLLSEYGPGSPAQLRMPWMQAPQTQQSPRGGGNGLSLSPSTRGLQMLGASQRRRDSFLAGQNVKGENA